MGCSRCQPRLLRRKRDMPSSFQDIGEVGDQTQLKRNLFSTMQTYPFMLRSFPKA